MDDTERLNLLEEWLRWHPGSRREIWTGDAGFQCVEKASAVDKPSRKLRDAIDALAEPEEPSDDTD